MYPEDFTKPSTGALGREGEEGEEGRREGDRIEMGEGKRGT